MNKRILSKVLGLILMLISVGMLACGVFAQYGMGGAEVQAARGLYLSGGITFLGGFVAWLLGWGKIEKIPRREGVMIVGLAWVLTGFFGALPYYLCDPGMDLGKSYFESVSGFTTTGSTVITALDEWPRSVLLWRALSQWLGGLGILVLFVAILSSIGGGAKSLFRNESSFQSGEASTARIRDTAQVLWWVYIGLTIICFLGMSVLGMGWFDALTHTMTTVSTGGFSPHDESIAYFKDWKTGLLIEFWIMIFMLICSVNFLIWVVILKRRWSRLKTEDEGVWLLGITAISIFLVMLSLIMRDGWGDFWPILRDVAFMVISIVSTTGYGFADYDLWPHSSVIVILTLMFIGGCSGSTSGGMKIGRFLVFLKVIYQEVVHAFRPNQIFRLRVNGNSLDSQARSQAILFVAIFGLFILFGAWVVSILETGQEHSEVTILSAVMSTLMNIGPGFGEVGPTNNYAHLQPATHFFLSLLMILGRLELFALMVLFVPGAWRKF